LNWIQFLAQVATPATAPTTQPVPEWFLFLQRFGPLILLGILFYFLVFGSKRKEQKKRDDRLSQLKKGDEVVTIGGQIGRVLDVRTDRVQLKVDENSNTKIWFLRSAIHRVLDDDKAETK
jgi:preprotein translocase subunit YajC